MLTLIDAYWHLAAHEVRERWERLRDGGDRGSLSVEFAVIAGVIVLAAIVIVGIVMAFGEQQANNIGN